MELRPYQESALEGLLDEPSNHKALIMPTGSGKTRVALAFAKQRMDKGSSVAYISESDALANQVLAEAEAIGVSAAWVPGLSSETAPVDVIESRKANLEDYDAGLILGVFTYASYFMGSNVPRAQTLIVDDAHALVGAHYSLSVVEINSHDFNGPYKRILTAIRDANPTLSRQMSDLDVPVHRGGPAVLVPPSQVSGVRDVILDLVRTAAEGTGYARFRLRSSLDVSSPHFLFWPCVITSASITWRPFIVPFESLGQAPGNPVPEQELVLLTATKGPQGFLETRLGMSSKVPRVPIPEGVPEMGTRLVLTYEDLGSYAPPSQAHVNVIDLYARRFGSLLVTVISDLGEARLRSRLSDDIQILRYRDRSTLDAFQKLSEPRVLVLVNRPVGVDLPSEVCRVAIHLDLPYSSSGHEVVEGDIERSGTVAEASLAVRLSQLLGRMNRSPSDRTAHIILAGPLPLNRGSTFTQSLDPVALLDLLIGQRGICRRFTLPSNAELLDHIEAFLEGDNALREDYREKQEETRDLLAKPGPQPFRPDVAALIEANLLVARGNFDAALHKYRRLAQDAAQSDSADHAAFYEYCQVSMADVLSAREEDNFGPGGRKGLLEQALNRNPGSPSLVAALRQSIAGDEQPEEGFYDAQMRLTLQRRSLTYYDRWIVKVGEEAPSEESLTDVKAWKKYWRTRFSAADHTDLLLSWTDAFQLLGSDSPKLEESQNDAAVSWKMREGQRTLALEAKGRQSIDGAESTELTVDDVVQAADNARRIDADLIVLATSKAKRQREVPSAARDRGVRVILEETATACADLMATQCAALEKVRLHRTSAQEIPFEMLVFDGFVEASEDLIQSGAVRKLLG